MSLKRILVQRSTWTRLSPVAVPSNVPCSLQRSKSETLVYPTSSLTPLDFSGSRLWRMRRGEGGGREGGERKGEGGRKGEGEGGGREEGGGGEGGRGRGRWEREKQ